MVQGRTRGVFKTVGFLFAHELGSIVVESVARGSVKGHGNDDVEGEEHSTLKVVRLAILNRVGDDQNRDGERHSLDCRKLAVSLGMKS